MQKSIKVTKMQGCGNDFAIIDYDEFQKVGIEVSEFSRNICDRHFGIGADGLIITNPRENLETDLGWIFYNSDGTTAQMCGNGMRCFAKYVYDKGIIKKRQFSVKTGAGIIKPEILEDGSVKVNMGKPILQDAKIPFSGVRKIKILDKEFDIFPVSMGNPHCVIFTNNSTYEMASKYGSYLEKHDFFPQKTNVEFVKILSPKEIEMCVYERGCGITLACGTGACASAVVSILNNLTEKSLKINLLGGAVYVEWSGSPEDLEYDVFLKGPAKYSFIADYML